MSSKIDPEARQGGGRSHQGGPLVVLLGREPEVRAIDRVLADARLGRSSALVLRGDPGIGKTTLLDYAFSQASAMRVLSARGVEFEADVPFAGLHELLLPALDRLDRLAAVQAEALRSALGLGPRTATDRLLVGAATLALISAFAEEAPLLLLVDDAQWLDRASAEALAFAVRRLLADPVAALVTVREGEGLQLLEAGLPELRIGGLERRAAVALLEREAGALPAEVAERIVEATAGNPLALRELAGEATALAPSGGLAPLPAATSVERAYLRRLVGLHEGARQALLLMAASGAVEVGVIQGAAARLGLKASDVEAAEAASAGLLVERGGRLQFVHPLARAAVYHAATNSERRAAHHALAEVSTGAEQADRRAWHLAAAATGRDSVAAEALEGAGARAAERSAYAAAAAAYEEAARLTEAGERRAHRLLQAAQNSWLSGRAEHAVELLEAALPLARDLELQVDITGLRGYIAMHRGAVQTGLTDVSAAAAAIESRDRAKAIRMLAGVTQASYGAGQPASLLPAAQHALDLLREDDPPELAALAYVAYGTVAILTGHGSDGPRHLHDSLALFERIGPDIADPDLLMCAGLAGLFLREAETSRDLLALAEAGARAHAPTAALPRVVQLLARDEAATERWTQARGHYEEAIRLSRETTQTTWLAGSLSGLVWLDALEGRADEFHRHLAEALDLTTRYGMGFFRSWCSIAGAYWELGAGRPELAVPHLLDAGRVLAEAGIVDPDLAPTPDLVDAYLRLGRIEEARAAAAAYEPLAVDKGQPFALARAARVRAMLATDAEFAAEFETALRHHAGTPDTFERARTQLMYGERLRRERRRVEARKQLRAALLAFDALGARPWAVRASLELQATGETARAREDSFRLQLTPQELQVALALAEGRTTREAAAKLFLSPKTVEYHLRNVYDKLEVRSREGLQQALRSRP